MTGSAEPAHTITPSNAVEGPNAPVSTERDGGVLVIRLSNPAARNAIDLPMATALAASFGDLDDVGAIALLADGEQFCVGGNVRAMAAAPDPSPFIQELADELHKSLLAMAAAPPVVVGVQGWAAGAGMSLVCACDIVLAAESAQFQPAYPGIGVTPDGGMSWNLPRIVGERRARSLILRNAVVSAQQAQQLGIVDEIVPAAELTGAVLALARTLADGPRAALAGVKRLVLDSTSRSYAEQLDAEAASIAACAGSGDGREGLAAFTQRRKPRFGQ